MGVYHLDFFCEGAELKLELDGNQHGFPEQREHDEAREKFLKWRGIKTLQVLEFATPATTLEWFVTPSLRNCKSAHRIHCRRYTRPVTEEKKS